MPKPVKLKDLAEKLDISIGTVDRALHGRPGINPETRKRILEAAKRLGYKPNLAASVLRTGRSLRIAVVLPEEIASFWNEVKAGIEAEHAAIASSHVELLNFPFPRLGKDEDKAIHQALKAKVNGIITVGGTSPAGHASLQRAAEAGIPVVFAGSLARNLPGLAYVATNPQASGSLAAELIGRSHPDGGGVIVVLGDRRVPDHAEKLQTFKRTIAEYFPKLKILAALETHDDAAEASRKIKRELAAQEKPVACYITTANSLPIISALTEDSSDKNPTIITTDIFPALAAHIKAGRVAATIHQRPRSQGTIAFRHLYSHLASGVSPEEVTVLYPQIIFRSNLRFFA